jgi:HSP20 family protein
MARDRDPRGLPEEIEELFADLWQVPRFSGLRRGFRPSADCVRIDDPPTLHFTFELAGIEAADIRIDATSTSLTIRGVRRRPVEARRVLQVEIEIGPFERHLQLPEEVDVERATARLEHGLLTIVLPIAERPLAPVKVPIEVDVP